MFKNFFLKKKSRELYFQQMLPYVVPMYILLKVWKSLYTSTYYDTSVLSMILERTALVKEQYRQRVPKSECGYHGPR